MPRLTKGNATYAPTTVHRYVIEASEQKLIETYEDATVRDQGEGGFLRIPQAMLRAYSNDPNFFGDETYQNGNGIHVQTKAEAKRFATYYSQTKVEQFVMDCDQDIALKRVMAYVLGKHSFGHGSEEWTVLVGYDKDDDEWGGWGDDQFRIEKWRVNLRKDS